MNRDDIRAATDDAVDRAFDRPIPEVAAYTAEGFALAVEFVERSGIVPMVEAWLHKATGRRRTVNVMGIFVGLFLLACNGKPLWITSVRDVLWKHCPEHLREQLGVVGHIDTERRQQAVDRALGRLLLDLLWHMDSSPMDRGRRMSRDEVKARWADLAARRARGEAADEDEKDRRLDEVGNMLIQAAVSFLDAHALAAWKGSVGLDATPLPLYARGPTRGSDLASADPTGAWYVRDGDHSEPVPVDAKGLPRDKNGRLNVHWALDLSIAVMAADEAGDRAAFPTLVVGYTTDRPGFDPGGNGRKVLRSIRDRGHPAGWAGMDRAYNNSKPETLQIPMAALGYRGVFDYTADQLGVQDSYAGAVQVEGAWYCPALPDVLRNCTRDYLDRRIDAATLERRLLQRASYALWAKAAATPTTNARLSCPAARAVERVKCANKPDSLGGGPDGRLKVLSPPAPIGGKVETICAQQSVTMPAHIGAKHGQSLVYRSPEWYERYATLRNSIEGLNGYAKSGGYEGLGDADRRRIMGRAANHLFAGFLLAAANLRKIRRFHARLAEVQRLNGPDVTTVKIRRRKRKDALPTLADLAPAMTAADPDPPPGLAVAD